MRILVSQPETDARRLLTGRDLMELDMPVQLYNVGGASFTVRTRRPMIFPEHSLDLQDTIGAGCPLVHCWGRSDGGFRCGF